MFILFQNFTFSKTECFNKKKSKKFMLINNSYLNINTLVELRTKFNLSDSKKK